MGNLAMGLHLFMDEYILCFLFFNLRISRGFLLHDKLRTLCVFLNICLYIHIHLEMETHIHYETLSTCFIRKVGERVKMDQGGKNIFIRLNVTLTVNTATGHLLVKSQFSCFSVIHRSSLF